MIKLAKELVLESFIYKSKKLDNVDADRIVEIIEAYHSQFQISVPYQKCPKCDGQGTVSKPPYVPGDVNQWSSTSTTFTCDICNGQKIIPQFIPQIERPQTLKEGYVIKSFKHNGEIVGYLSLFSATGQNSFSQKRQDAYVFGKKEECIFTDGQVWELGRDGGSGYYKIERI